MPKFRIVECVGCIAIVDETYNSEETPGLHPDTPGVVKFKMGILVDNPRCPTCGHCDGMHWEVPAVTREKFAEECRQMNAEN